MLARSVTAVLALSLILMGAAPPDGAGTPAPAQPAKTADAGAGKPSKTVSVGFTGDISFTWRAWSVAWDDVPWEKNPLRPVKHLFEAVDFAVGNAEAVYMKKNPKYAIDKWNLWVPAAGAKAFKPAGIDLVTVANNHTMDGRAAGVHETLQRLRDAGTKVIGAGKSWAEATRPHVYRQDGTCTAIIPATRKINKPVRGDAFVALYRKEEGAKKLLAEVARVKKADPKCFVVVYVHWGKQFQKLPKWQRPLAHKIIDAGADMILGHHSHVLGTVERYKDKWIAYQIGNFVMSSPWESTRQTGVWRLLLKVGADGSTQLDRFDMSPVYVQRRGYWPRPSRPRETKAIFKLLRDVSKDFGTTVALEGGDDKPVIVFTPKG